MADKKPKQPDLGDIEHTPAAGETIVIGKTPGNVDIKAYGIGATGNIGIPCPECGTREAKHVWGKPQSGRKNKRQWRCYRCGNTYDTHEKLASQPLSHAELRKAVTSWVGCHDLKTKILALVNQAEDLDKKSADKK